MTDDTISRQAAIDEIKRWIGYIDEDMILKIQTGLKKVPSAQVKLDENDMPEQQESDKLGVKTGETCTDCISRQAARDALCDNCDNVQAVCAHYPCKQYIAVEKLPSAQPKRKKGKWIYLNGLDAFECSVCGRQMVRNIFDYCPWCGAEMTKGEEDE